MLKIFIKRSIDHQTILLFLIFLITFGLFVTNHYIHAASAFKCEGSNELTISKNTTIAGDLAFTGTLNSGTVPWERLDGLSQACDADKYVSGFNGSVPICNSISSVVNSVAVGLSQWTTSGNDIYYNKGNIGIGTPSPRTKLDVLGSTVDDDVRLAIGFPVATEPTKGRSMLELNSSWGSHLFLVAQGGKAEPIHGIPGNVTGISSNWRDLVFATGPDGTSIERMRIASTGNVGIGTNDPKAILDVNGNARITPTPGNWIEGLQFYMPTKKSWGGLRWSRAKDNYDGNWAIGYNGMDETDDLVFTANNAGTQINDVLRLTKSGNIGIGTNDPKDKLHVSGGNLVLGHNNGINLWDGTNLSNVMVGYGIYNYGHNLQISPGGELIIGSGEAGHALRSIPYGGGSGHENLLLASDSGIQFWVDLQEPDQSKRHLAMTIKGDGIKGAALNDGYVGIGTSDPQEKLEVADGNILGTVVSSNYNAVGLETNILFNANNRYTVTQTGTAALYIPLLFDGNFQPSYTGSAPTRTDPTIILIEGLPNYHIQAGAWIGWSTRYWPAKHFKIEGFVEQSIFNAYPTYGFTAGWNIIADFSSKEHAGSRFLTKIGLSGAGAFTKLKFTFYEARGESGRMGVSELFFLHPEVSRLYSGLLPSSMWEGKSGNVGIGTKDPQAKLDVVGNEKFYPEYSNAQVLAEATCTALKPSGGWTFAVRRECGTGPDCNAVCAGLREGQPTQNLSCFNALHIYGNQPHESVSAVGLKTYKYNSCGGNYCGPNYCCCGI